MSFEGQDIDNYGEEDGHRKRDTSRKRDGKRDKKEKGYTMFEEEDSEGESFVTPDDVKSPSKAKKDKGKPSFKFPVRKEKVREKDEKKDKDAKKEEKEKRKEEKEGKKLKKDKKKSKLVHHDPAASVPVPSTYENPIFGVPLALAVDRNKSHDGIELPAIFRECVDYIEECGLTCEGIYRISGVKSKVQALKDSYNRHQPIYLYEHEPNIVASLLKQFLRDLPEPVLTTTLMPKFEEASTAKSNKKKVELFIKLIADLPTCNRMLLSWMIVHMSHVIHLAKENKMTLQNVSIVLSPTMKISHRVLNVLFSNVDDIFGDVQLRKYVPPLRPAHSKWSLELPDNPSDLEEELAKQESLLNQLHADLNSGVTDPVIEEQLWEVQRVVTQLKRKIKLSKKGTDTGDRRRPHEPKRCSNSSLPSLSAPEELQLQLRQAPEPDNSTSVPATATSQTKERPSSKEGEVAVNERPKSVKFAVEEKVSEEGEKAADDIRETTSQDEHEEDVEPPAEKAEVEERKNEEDEQEPTNEIKENAADIEGASPENDTSQKIDQTRAEMKDEKKRPASQSEAVKLDESPVVMKPPDMKEQEEEIKTNETYSEVSESQTKEIGDDKTKSSTQPEAPKETSRRDDVASSVAPVEKASSDTSETKASETLQPASALPASKKSKPAPEPVGKPVPPFMSLTLLEPVKAEIPKPKQNSKDEDVDERETLRKSEELRELEEELLGEKKEKVAPNTSEDDVFQEDPEIDDDQLEELLEDEYALVMEEEELRAIEDELRQKIATERSEMERLAQEIQELQYLRQDSDLEDLSSDSNSSDESEDEDDLQDLLSQIIKDNEQLEMQNADMCQKIHEERMICLSVKLQIRLLQQKQLETSIG